MNRQPRLIQRKRARPHAVAKHRYERWLDDDAGLPDVLHVGSKRFDRRWVLVNLHTLTGKDLACTCGPDVECHADELLRRANPLGGGQT